jgi:phosphoglycolate phosphatase
VQRLVAVGGIWAGRAAGSGLAEPRGSGLAAAAQPRDEGGCVSFAGVIFDLDGTLVDTLEDIADAMNRVLSAREFAVHSYAAYKGMIGHGIRRLVADALPPDHRDETTVRACHESMMGDYAQHCLVKTRPYDGVAELLAELRAAGVPLAVLSNKADELTRKIAAALLGAATFAVVMGARADVPTKPDPAGALLVSRQLGVPPERLTFVGDSGVDMLTAVRAGMTPVGVAWGFRDREELVLSGAGVVLDHPLELLALQS